MAFYVNKCFFPFWPHTQNVKHLLWSWGNNSKYCMVYPRLNMCCGSKSPKYYSMSQFRIHIQVVSYRCRALCLIGPQLIFDPAELAMSLKSQINVLSKFYPTKRLSWLIAKMYEQNYWLLKQEYFFKSWSLFHGNNWLRMTLWDFEKHGHMSP